MPERLLYAWGKAGARACAHAVGAPVPIEVCAQSANRRLVNLQVLEYSIVAGNNERYFDIDNSTGKVGETRDVRVCVCCRSLPCVSCLDRSSFRATALTMCTV